MGVKREKKRVEIGEEVEGDIKINEYQYQFHQYTLIFAEALCVNPNTGPIISEVA